MLEALVESNHVLNDRWHVIFFLLIRQIISLIGEAITENIKYTAKKELR